MNWEASDTKIGLLNYVTCQESSFTIVFIEFLFIGLQLASYCILLCIYYGSLYILSGAGRATLYSADNMSKSVRHHLRITQFYRKRSTKYLQISPEHK